ncbi:DUF1464 family protein [Staphylothermus hellenicus]|uniref:Butyrate kinase-like protein n=1 Tax=Staphylothermus hellenicus (strain DSM 12710 / JCM 10830 / BK20S6-10-b1 / P8) TaxID=591019 RepID=D7D9L7_STAHD|nr:DUF1464 family protein [Staphylothermus hellenicus]ADI32463.1 butyrate kinase-like protein [Staphylothermus hellenicus DSM 12710]
MARALGIDPGTKSFDLVVVEDDKVILEKSIDTKKVALNPKILIDAVLEIADLDLIAGPSGYGVPVTFNKDIIDPGKFALEILLLTRTEDIVEGRRRGHLGINVYDAIAKIVEEFWKSKLNVVYIPSVILLPTVPSYRKINKIDMGTADKMAVAVLAIYDQARKYGIEYSETSFILVELGFGYNAVIGVDKGRIVDGIGGTLASMGFLTIGAIDAEIAAMKRKWSRLDVFRGGIIDICKVDDLSEVFKRATQGEEECINGIEAFIEGIIKSVSAMSISVRKPREILLSGRYSRIKELRKILEERLAENYAIAIRELSGLRGAVFSKEAAQGYAIVAEGLANGFFSKLISYTRIPEARGTVLDWVYHPGLYDAKRRLHKIYAETVKSPRF